MEILGIGPLELLFILLIVLIIFGPKDLQKAGKTLGDTIRKIARSDTWKTVTQASRKIRTLPNDLMREAGLDELNQSPFTRIRKSPNTPQDETWTVEPVTPPDTTPPDSPQDDPNISPRARKKEPPQ